MRPHASAQRAFMTVATACLAHADANQPHLSIDDPEVLHQFRVAYRRLRSLLSLAREVTKSDPEGMRLKVELRELAANFGEARDLDVFLETNSHMSEADHAKIDAARVRAYEKVAATLDSAAWEKWHDSFDRWLDKGKWRKSLGDEPWTGRTLARHALSRRRSRIVGMGKTLDELSAYDRHQVRIEAKKLRYGCQFFAPLWPEQAAEISAMEKSLATIQDALGKLNDAATWEHMVTLADLDHTDAPHVDEDVQLVRAQNAVDELTGHKPFWRV